MDMHITTTPDLDDRVGTPLGKPMSLPGAREASHRDIEDHLAEHGEAAASEIPSPEPRETLAPGVLRKRGRRKALLAPAAFLLVVAGSGAAAWTLREHLVAFPYHEMTAKLRNQLTLLMGPAPSPGSASTMPVPANQAPVEVGTKADMAPRTAVAAATPVAPAPAIVISPQEVKTALERSEFASYKLREAVVSDSPSPVAKPTEANLATPSVTAPAVTPPASTVSAAPTNAPVLIPAPVVPSTAPAANLAVVGGVAEPPVAEVGANKTSSPPAAAPAVTAASVKPRDAVQTAIELHPAPMAPKEIVNTAGLVRELGAQLEETRLRVSQQTATIAELKEQIETRITDFDTRLSLAEAGAALVRSAKAGTPQPNISPTSVAHTATATSRTPTSPTTVTTTAPAVPVTRSIKDYRIQGASPGMVVLNVINPSPGEAPALFLSLGEQVPGLGRLKSVQQRGTAWVAQTDAGLIQ